MKRIRNLTWSPRPRSLRSVLGALSLSALTLAGTVPADAVRDDLTETVRQAFLARRLERSGPPVREPLVETIRRAHGWVLGTVTEPVADGVHGAPDSHLYLARPDGRRWRVELDDSAAFGPLAAAAPLLSGGEREVLTSAAGPTGRAAPTGLGLPWPVGESWYLGGGAHGQHGRDRPFSSLDFNGGDGDVRAPAPGILYRSCVRGNSALVTLVHAGGFSTTYYHMTNLTKVKDGTRVAAGDYLGHIGTAVPCGGYASGRHVHFSLRSGLAYLGVDGTRIGGWTFREGQRAYGGHAERAGEAVRPGGALTNFGP